MSQRVTLSFLQLLYTIMVVGTRSLPVARIAKNESLHYLSHNYYLAKLSTQSDLQGKINPVTKQPYTSADILMETNKLFKDLDHTQLHDLTPVDEQQATDLLHKYYTERYGTEEGTRKERDDIKKRRAKPLRPGTPESSQYRPRYSSKGVLQMSGPELFDIAGVDDAPSQPRRKPTRVKRN